MELALKNNQLKVKKEDTMLFKMLDSGIDDMEMGRELPIDRAFEKVTELRNIRRNVRV